MKNYIECQYEFIVTGGGMGGICAAIAAARKGVKTALIHDRPVLGGNASSEIRMHICGADDHMNRPNARETGILEELLLENKRRNPQRVYPIFDSVLWEKVHFQENLTLYLNTHMTEVLCEGSRIVSIEAEQLTTEKTFRFTAGLFLDATGDGTLGAKAGADFSIGRESCDQYGESLEPEEADRFTMGNSLMFQSRDMGRPVRFHKPFWANTYTEDQLKLRDHSDVRSGYWWIEMGGGIYDTISDAETLRDELLKAVFGVWDHIKNGGSHGADQMELEWVGFLPGKRESRRLLGDYVLNENDCRSGKIFEDTVAYGGWSMDVHTVEGFLNESDEPTVWNKVNDVYTIPYRCLYSRNIENLFLGGRAISCSHAAFSSTRVMATCAVAGQAAGTAAALAAKKGLSPREVLSCISELQQELLKDDCYLPGFQNLDEADRARTAAVTASHCLDGYAPEGVLTGVSRIVKQDANCWRAAAADRPEIELHFPEAFVMKELRITLDSNLSREITPSINGDVLSRQEFGPPSELVRDYEVEWWLGTEMKERRKMESGGQRLQVISCMDEVMCDRVVVRVLSTYGSPAAGIFEIRAY